MGKRKDKDKDKVDVLVGKKKQKKHKKHKKKRDRITSEDNKDIDVVNDDSLKDEGKGLKLKIKFGGQMLGTTEVVSDDVKEEEEDYDNDDDDKYDMNTTADTTDGDMVDDDTDSEKHKKNEDDLWLEALEKGELDDTGGLKKEKDTSLMTARQRALCGENVAGETELMQLPMYPERTEEENEEVERKRKLRAKKRRQQMQKQIEETKTQTIEKLLTKGQKGKKDAAKSRRTIGSHIRYTNNQDGISLSYMDEADYPIKIRETVRVLPTIVMCSVQGCRNAKKYACSKTKLPICSLQCYKQINNHYTSKSQAVTT